MQTAALSAAWCVVLPFDAMRMDLKSNPATEFDILRNGAVGIDLFIYDLPVVDTTQRQILNSKDSGLKGHRAVLMAECRWRSEVRTAFICNGQEFKDAE